MEIVTDDIKKYDQKWWNRLYKNHTHKPTRNDVIHWQSAKILLGPRSVIDIGCGEGHFAPYPSGEYLGIDWSAEAIAKCRKRFPDKNFQMGTVDNMISKGKHFEAAVCFEIMEHMEDPVAFITKVKSIADMVIVTIPKGRHGKTVMLNDRKLINQFSEDYKYHYATYDANDILRMFGPVRFIKVDLYHLMFVL